MGLYTQLLFPTLSLFSPWGSHSLSLGVAQQISNYVLLQKATQGLFDYCDPRLEVPMWRTRLASPVGLAAGIDKNAVAVPFWDRLGFSFFEIGTVTPQPQKGTKRVWRVPGQRALINNLQFPNIGAVEVQKNLKKLRGRRGLLGGNIGPNAISVKEGRSLEDYLVAFDYLYDWVDYIVINISSPNTVGLRELQQSLVLRTLLKALKKRRDSKAVWKPLVVKISPDFPLFDVYYLAEIFLAVGIDGVIIANSTKERPPSLGLHRDKPGGLSGELLFDRTTHLVSLFFLLLGEKIPIIASGGVFSHTVEAKIRAGAHLVEFCTGLIYEGPGVVKKTNKLLVQAIEKANVKSIQDLVGVDASKTSRM